VEEVGSVAKLEPIRLTTSGMCAGVVIGIAETLRTLELACPPYQVSNEQLIRMVVEEIEKHPERMPEEFSVLAREVMIAAGHVKGSPPDVPCWRCVPAGASGQSEKRQDVACDCLCSQSDTAINWASTIGLEMEMA
jgi:hypothetical protein